MEVEKSIHYSQKGCIIQKIVKVGKYNENLQVEYQVEDDRPIRILTETSAFFNPAYVEQSVVQNTLLSEPEKGFDGDVRDVYSWKEGKHKVEIALTQADGEQNYFSVPYLIAEQGMKSLHPDVLKQRIWEKNYSSKNESLSCPLRFRIVPGHWPNIQVKAADMLPDDITAYVFEVHFEIKDIVDKQVKINLPYIDILWKCNENKLLCGRHELDIDVNNELAFSCIFDRYVTEVIWKDKVLVVLNKFEQKEKYVDDVSGNLEKIRIEEEYNPRINVQMSKGIADVKIFGLRGLSYSVQAERMLKRQKKKDRLLFANERFKVFSNHIEDYSYGKPDAYVVSPYEIVSVDRVLEEFEWRQTKWGDMTRKNNRSDYWKADASILNYPQLKTDTDILSAVWNLAISTFAACSERTYSLAGQEDMWQAGMFQGKGEGFGVWLRDSVHVAIRGGNLIDPETARRTLCYVIRKGFDNGSDGPAMGSVGVWDYYLATADASILWDNYQLLLDMMKDIEERFDEKRGLVRAEQSTSNDAFPEPENGGFSLGSECYYMKAYENMAKIEKVLYGDTDQSCKWKERAESIRTLIKQEYWNAEAGYFTSGPKGSMAYKHKIWETSGAEAAVWDKFAVASDEQCKSILKKGVFTAFTPYGICVFPNRKEHNHFVGTVWPVWESGFASACAKQKEEKVLLTMLCQQMRTAVLHKNFYEVLESESGVSWRWPGQLWHAAGFIAQVLYGLFGISYTEEGLYFNPCIPREIGNVEIENLKYQSSILSIKIDGRGSKKCVILDGEVVRYIPSGIKGKHDINIVLTE